MVNAPDTEAPPESPGWRYYLQRKIIVIFFLGVSSGLPFPLVYSTLSAWLEEAGVERSTISTFAWLGFAYSLKFIWAPIVDNTRVPLLCRWLGRRRGWMLTAQLSIGAALLIMAGVDPAQHIEAFALIAFAVAFSSATQDIVIDAYRIESAEDRMQGVLAAAYQYGYRISLLVSMAGALYLAEFSGWATTYKVMAGCMIVGILTTLACREPPNNRGDAVTLSGPLGARIAHWLQHAVVDPFLDFYRRFGKALFLILLFVSFYRMSDYVLGILANPFYLDIGYSKSTIATVAKVYGAWVTILGVGLGGWAVVRFGVARCLVIATTLIASTNLFFAVNALVGAEAWMLAVTISADNIAQGFGGTVLIAYLSSLTNRDFTATQYALLSSFMALLPKFLAGFSGNVQESTGWLGFFLYAAAMGVPAIVLAFVVARKHDRLVAARD
ncbi:MAG: AmpG family muropeptide MFS transporter [Xanthomonadales bacterium]|nr:AmpG family muropeptide MFS transporter [Xanthomonadales bacterium]